jgi:hypothetical protein
MAQTSGFHSTTGGVAVGHQVANYSEALLTTAYKIIAACHGDVGIAPSYLNALAPTAGGANTVNVATGAAIVNGYWYLNDAVQAVTIPSSGGGTIRYDRVVLRHTGSPTFTVVLTVLTGSAIMPPAKGANDVDICTVLVTDAGAVTVTDAREYARIQTAGLADLAATTAKLATNALSADAAGRAKMQDGFINTDKMGAAAVTYSRIQDVGACGVPARAANTAGVLATVQAAANNRVLMRKADVLTFAQIEADQLADGASKVARRQGGSATIWSTPGTTSYTPAGVDIQAGTFEWTGASAPSGYAVITFPRAFAYAPVINANAFNAAGATGHPVTCSIYTVSATQVSIYWYSTVGASYVSMYLMWTAIGPMA